MSAHTPGPWSVEESGGDHRVEAVNSGEVVARIARWTPDVDRADAHLIAAAPDLYAALKLVVAGDDVKSLAQIVAAMDDARAALAKAEGK